MSLFEVVRAAFSTPHAHGFLDHRRKPMKEPNLRIARGDAHTVLFREQRGDVPNARSRTGRRRALRPPARSVRRFDQKRVRNSHTSFAPTFSFCTRFRQELRMQRPSLATLRCTHGLGAHPRLAKGMSRRLQQSTIFIFQRRTPTSCIDDSTTPEPLGRALVEESLHSRRGSRFGASMRCHPVLGRVNRLDGSSDIPSHLELQPLDRAPASQGRFHRATRDGSSSAFTAWDTFGRDPTSALLPP